VVTREGTVFQYLIYFENPVSVLFLCFGTTRNRVAGGVLVWKSKACV